MPTYEYECNTCGKVFELFQPITEAPRKKLRKDDPHPCKCNAAVTRRISTGGGLIFKGSGFYITDYRSDGYKKAAESESNAGKPKNEDKASAVEKTATSTSSSESTTTSTKSDAPAKPAAAPAKPSKKKR
ncbi:MAG: zinc ribbon domain-containing protein [Planctomycetes bacterium]|nr:zinc ribbon domain-containing protein [Planctomycetota bacterium]MBI3834195.1 zinc ribbon domain-containing protein [Planctomycetota bacterium]